MSLKSLKLSLTPSLIVLLLVASESGYSYQNQNDSRGFPQSSGSFAPRTAPSPSIAKPFVQNHNKTFYNYNHQNQNNYQHHNFNHNYYYYNTGVYPYYLYPGDDDSYDYSAAPDSAPPDSDSAPTANANDDQASLPSYDPSSLPYGTWVTTNDGSVPDKAFVYQINNGAPLYYCRAQYKYTTYYGVLTPNVGCYIQDQSAIIHLNQYDVLVSPN